MLKIQKANSLVCLLDYRPEAPYKIIKHPMNPVRFLSLSLFLLAGCAGLFNKKNPVSQQKPNVLFICIDDMRPELKVYGNPLIQAPHLEQLAARS